MVVAECKVHLTEPHKDLRDTLTISRFAKPGQALVQHVHSPRGLATGMRQTTEDELAIGDPCTVPNAGCIGERVHRVCLGLIVLPTLAQQRSKCTESKVHT